MPGLTLLPRSASQSSVRDALSTYAARTNLEMSCLRAARPTVLATHNDATQLVTCRLGDVWFAVEGVLYGTDLRDRLSSLAPLLFESNSPASTSHEALYEWLRTTDGDFVIAAVHQPSRQWRLINDAMGRLPLYSAPEPLCVTRDYPLFYHLSAAPALDRLGAAQMLHLGYPLGRRTLLSDVHRLFPATLLSGAPRSSPDRQTLGPPAFAYRPESPPASAADLVEAFVTATKRRAGWNRGAPTLALSGGLDSRAVACALKQTSASFQTTTFERADGLNNKDVRGAEALRRTLSLPGETVSLPAPTGRDLRFLMDLKGGLNALDIAHLVPFLQHARSTTPAPGHLLTGDGGILLRDLRPASPLSSIESVAAALERSCRLPADLAAPCVGVSPEALRMSVRERLDASAADSVEQAAIAFELERAYKFAHEGEDRNRYFAWSSTPFYSLPFAARASSVPACEKVHFSLYRDFLEVLDPRSLEVGYADFSGVRMTSFQLALYRWIRAAVRAVPPLLRLVRTVRGQTPRYAPDAPRLQCLRAHLPSAPTLDAGAVNAVLERSRDRLQVNLFLTLVAADRLRTGKSPLQPRYDDVTL
jgi:asparagine synthase (glutamine-hydrolysing)